ncbi:NAD-dependent deacetylase [Clostridiales bacterium PH28_bin88]|nr:NAD-dependent deacetylase [Clostridiales bacterium PH28_bin88]
MDYLSRIAAAADLLRQSNRTYALTGAGVSTESGIPDYRSPGTGLWEKLDPMTTASARALLSDPAAFYRHNLERWTAYTHVEPNAAHRAIAGLEEMGLLQGVVTQNIDGLHLKAGSRRVWEVHGHLRTCHCMSCKQSYPFTRLTEQYHRGINPPRCTACQGVLRPDIVLFQDPMGQDYAAAEKALSGCQLLLAAGTSLQVYPVAAMPVLARRLVIINRDPTPWDDRAALVIHDRVGKVFTDIMNRLQMVD